MIELLLPCGFHTLEYSWVKATIGICTLGDYSMAKKHQLTSARRWRTGSGASAPKRRWCKHDRGPEEENQECGCSTGGVGALL
jgi:hypothetical protein